MEYRIVKHTDIDLKGREVVRGRDWIDKFGHTISSYSYRLGPNFYDLYYYISEEETKKEEILKYLNTI